MNRDLIRLLLILLIIPALLLCAWSIPSAYTSRNASSLVERSFEEVSTDIFVTLPGVEMDVRNVKLFNDTMSSALTLYPKEYVHVVYNTGDPTYIQPGQGGDFRNHVVQNDNFALGAFAAAASWMDKFRPKGNFMILQHSTRLITKAASPACDIELVNIRQRCGSDNLCVQHVGEMLTGFGTESCFPLLTEIMQLYNSTCTFPCCPSEAVKTRGTLRHDIKFWPLMAHNAIMFTQRARIFLLPLKEFIEKMSPSTVGKEGDLATERLFGLFSTILLHENETIQSRSAATANINYSDPLEAYKKETFTCFQDISLKEHGGLV